MPTISSKTKLLNALKAANYSGRAGSTIIGNLTRGNDGKFSSGGGGASAAPKPDKAQAAAQQRQAKADLAARQRQERTDQQAAQREERTASRDQAKTDAQQKAVENVGNLAEKLLDPDMAEVLTVGEPLGNIEGVQPEYGDKLVARGLATKYEDGSYDLNPTGRSMINAMKKGNERQAKVAIMRAKAQADRKAAVAARRAKRGKKEQFVLAIKAAGSFRAYKNYEGATIRGEIATKATARLPFTVFKDAAGRYRWVGVSSSAAEDQDGETVAAKALGEDVARKDATKSYGPLNWWHTPIKLGTCDFNVMDGPLLVESGTFVSDAIAKFVAKAISDGLFEPGMSLEFEHNEPGPPVLPGRVFKTINKVGRALLPAHKASNLLTSFKVYSQKSAALAHSKGSKEMIPEEKLKLLERMMPPELLSGLLAGNEVAIKSAELAGMSFKAMTPPVVEDKELPKLDAKADGAVLADDLAMEPPVDDAPVEDPAGDSDADAIIQGLYDEVDAIIGRRMQSTADEIVAKLQGIKSVSDETSSAIVVALKENTSALNTVIAENTSLKARLDALEGKQPPAVRARVSQAAGLTREQLETSHKELVTTEKSVNPYSKIAEQLGLVPVSQQG